MFGHLQIQIKIDIRQVFKDQLSIKFPWVEHVVGLEGKLQNVHCKTCIVVEGKEKLLNLKLDGLQKHYGKQSYSCSCKHCNG
jgi:hypothetical protein